MSNAPHPVASLAALLMERARDILPRCCTDPHRIAGIASTLHRLAKATARQALAECNGEFYDGQRDALARIDSSGGSVQALDASIAHQGDRLDMRIAAINLDMWDLEVEAYREGEPRGFTLRLRSTDPAWPMPSNGMEPGVWGIG